MALTDPVELQPKGPIAHDSQAEPLLRQGDVGRVRLYFRLAAVLSSLTMIVLATIVAWICILQYDLAWRSARILVPLAVIVVIAAVRVVMAEMRLRTYRLGLTEDAVIFEFGRVRSYVPRQQVQVFDAESGFLLRRFGLMRCNLHTGGGMVIVSPVPSRAVAAIERLISETLLETHVDQTNARA